ncbi:MAG: carboxypeptidase-like regulatory domain-containing protein, partial [Bacteroidota bacterium]|nr:carboxypeptidase-like regulatory domain-containing protein [Bacteroidota bacterium]
MKYKFIALCMMLGLIASASFAQTIKVTGTVSGKADGQPLIGAGVVVVGTSTGTSTDSRGAFELTVPAGSQLEVSYIGYTSVIVDAAANLFIELEEDLDFLEE